MRGLRISSFGFRVLGFALFAGAILAAVPALQAHSFHASLAQADYNGETHALEFSLRLFSNDLERALTARAGHEVKLESKEADALAAAYLAEKFTVSADGTPVAIRYVGKEAGVHETWLYFESRLEKAPAKLSIAHTLLHEWFEDQVNSVIVGHGEGRVTVTFTPGEKAKEIVFPAAAIRRIN